MSTKEHLLEGRTAALHSIRLVRFSHSVSITLFNAFFPQKFHFTPPLLTEFDAAEEDFQASRIQNPRGLIQSLLYFRMSVKILDTLVTDKEISEVKSLSIAELMTGISSCRVGVLAPKLCFSYFFITLKKASAA